MPPSKTVFPQDHWSPQVDMPESKGLACGNLIYLCGQADLVGDRGEAEYLGSDSW